MFFDEGKKSSSFHTSTISDIDNPIHFDIYDSDDHCYLGNIPAAPSRAMGRSVRICRNTSKQDYAEGLYIGNDGKIYRTICLAGIEFTADNIAETKFRNGNDIVVITNLVEWVNLTTAAMCAYDNDHSNI